MGSQDSWRTIPVASLVIVVSAVLVLSCGQTDRHTKRDRCRWTTYSRESRRRLSYNSLELWTVSNNSNTVVCLSRRFTYTCTGGCTASSVHQVLPGGGSTKWRVFADGWWSTGRWRYCWQVRGRGGSWETTTRHAHTLFWRPCHEHFHRGIPQQWDTDLACLWQIARHRVTAATSTA